MRRLLSDRYRPMVTMVACFLLAGLCGWWVHLTHGGVVGYLGLVEDPLRFDGQPKVLSLVRVAEILDADRMRVRQGTVSIGVRGPTLGLSPGDEITAIGSWRAEGPWLEVDQIVPAPGRAPKRRLGLLGLLGVALFLPAWFRLTRRGVVIRG